MTDSWWLNPCKAVDTTTHEQALARQQQLTKPAGSLGQLEALAVRLAGRLAVRLAVLLADWLADFLAERRLPQEPSSPKELWLEIHCELRASIHVKRVA